MNQRTEKEKTTMQTTDNDPNAIPTLAGCAAQLRMIEKYAPAAFRALAAAISKAAADAAPNLSNYPLGADARTIAALRLTSDDVRKIALLSDQQERHTKAVGALDEDQRKVLTAMIPQADRAQFLASLQGSTP
jgi:hypothetical protein